MWVFVILHSCWDMTATQTTTAPSSLCQRSWVSSEKRAGLNLSVLSHCAASQLMHQQITHLMAFNGNCEKIKSHWYELLRSDSSDVRPDGGAVTPRPPPNASGFHVTLSKPSNLLTDERKARLRVELTGQCLTGCTRGLVVSICSALLLHYNKTHIL